MRKNYRKFNLICLILSVVFLIGIIWLYVRNYEKYEITNYEIQPTSNTNQIADNNLPPQQYNNITMEQSDNQVISTTIKQSTSTLSTSMNLVVPFTSQAPEKNWDQPWQDACEEAALLMLDAYYKNYNLSPLFAKDELLKMIKWEEEVKGWGRSIEMEKVKQAAEEYFFLSSRGLRAEPRGTRDLSEKQNSDKSKNDVINIISDKKDSSPYGLGMNVRIVENPTVEQIKKSIANGNPVLATADGKVLPNPHYRNGGPVYHALVIKGYTETEFITNDPGTQFGKDFKYKYNDLLNAVHDWNNGNVKEGRRVVLVVED